MLSVVIPVFNEEESLNSFYKELVEALAKLKISYEIIFVDDGSKDKTLDILKNFANRDKSIKIFSFRKNRGKSDALSVGFQKARGDYIVTIDADLQERPEEIAKLLRKSKEGFDIVCAWRKNRKDGISKNISSAVFNRLAHILWGIKIHDYNCGLKLYTKEAAKSITLYGGLHRFIPVLVAQQGFSVSEIAIEHNKRRFGHSKFGFSKLFKDSPDIFTMLFLSRYSQRPLHFFGMIGGFFFLIGTLILIYLSILRFQGQTIGDRPLLLFGVLMVITGFQIFFTGFLADLMTNLNQKNRFVDNPSMIKYTNSK